MFASPCGPVKKLIEESVTEEYGPEEDETGVDDLMAMDGVSEEITDSDPVFCPRIRRS